READRFQGAGLPARATSEVGDRAGHRIRPVVGVLLGPAGVRTLGRIAPGGARDRLAALVGQKRLEPRGSAVKPEIHGLALCSAAVALTSGSDRSGAKSQGEPMPVDQCRQAWKQEADGFAASQSISGSSSLSSKSTPCSRMYLRPERIG